MKWDLVPTPQGFINLVEGTLIFGSIAPKTTHILTEGMWHFYTEMIKFSSERGFYC